MVFVASCILAVFQCEGQAVAFSVVRRYRYRHPHVPVPTTTATGLAAVSDPSFFSGAFDALTTVAVHSPMDALPATMIGIDVDPHRYAFMLPIATLVATSCQLAGIGGAALFGPIFLLVFPLLGPDYPLPSPASAVATALLTEVFGFASGLSGYARRGLVDWDVAGRFAMIGAASAFGGALAAKSFAADPFVLRAAYAAFMLGLAAFLLLAPRPELMERVAVEGGECDLPCDGKDGGGGKQRRTLRTKTAADGTQFSYLESKEDSFQSAAATVAGGSLTGLLGVGIGEVVLPQLVRGSCMPLPLAAGTSVAVVVISTLTAALVQFASLASSVVGDGDMGLAQGLISVVPWSLVQYTIPGVLIGGQIAPFLASRGVADEAIELFAAMLFGMVGIAFAIKAVVG